MLDSMTLEEGRDFWEITNHPVQRSDQERKPWNMVAVGELREPQVRELKDILAHSAFGMPSQAVVSSC